MDGGGGDSTEEDDMTGVARGKSESCGKLINRDGNGHIDT